MATDILLESGTDELEILEFVIGNSSFGVNVLKIESIEQFDSSKLTQMPLMPPCISGLYYYRGTTVPVLDLAVELQVPRKGDFGYEESQEQAQGHGSAGSDIQVLLVMQFNSMHLAFLADGVRRIHRVNWKEISPINEYIEGDGTDRWFTGSVNIDSREILIADMEKIADNYFLAEEMLEITPEISEHPKQASRPDVKIMLAEDSKTVQKLIQGVLAKGNYTSLDIYDNGQAAYDELLRRKKQAEQEGRPISDFVNLVITDIEMPKMDGLTFCHHIKYAQNLTDLPVILYSSLRKDQMMNKCKDVQADAYITKPDCVRLVGMLDQICLDGEKIEQPQ